MLETNSIRIKIKAFPAGLLCIVFLLMAGCSAQKNTSLSRAYHNLTARYNVLFNAKESFKKGSEKINTGYKDDFEEILPIFPFSQKSTVALSGADMDRAIKKCSKLITLHSITAKPKVKRTANISPHEREFLNKNEYNIYVDDAYLLMGKAHVYKQEYSQASDIFHMLLNDFKNEPIIPETQIWLIRIYNFTRQYKNAEEILNTLLNKATFPQKYKPELFSTAADYYLRQKDYVHAITYLEKALPLEKHKKDKIRFTYIVAQLYEETSDLKKASEYYSQVIKLNPPYDMAFNARINRALAYEQGFGKADEIENELMKMLRDDKNIEYQDQIYYALGNLAAKEGNNAKAIEQYKKSIQVNVNNSPQKTHSFLTLANLYYSLPDYPNAQAYYDSAVSQLSPDYPDYETLFTKSKSLTRLVKEINAVQFADSMLQLSKLPKTELYAKIDAIIAKERQREEEERKKQQDEQLDRQFGTQVAANNLAMQQNTTGGTRWYFYNEAAKSLGYREFKLNWGNRKLEDHWQRQVKATTTFASTTGNEEGEQPDETHTRPESGKSKMSRDYYLAGIPTTDSAVAASLKKVENGLFNMGTIYKNELHDNEKAVEAYKELIRRFPASVYLPTAYYNLYSMAKEQNNMALEEHYKNIIAAQFPQTMYAKVLTNPDYVSELEKENHKVQDYYQTTYDLYKAENYSEVVSRSLYALNNFTGNTLIPRFAYIGTLAAGKSLDKKAFRENLLAFIAKYPHTDEATDAQNLVSYMDKSHPEIKAEQDKIASKERYAPHFDQEHLYGIIVKQKIDINQLVFNIINFNLDRFDSLNLQVNIADLKSGEKCITVKPFSDRDIVMNYFHAIEKTDAVFKDIPKTSIIPIAISSENFTLFKNDNSSDLYLEFFKENYH